MGERVGFIGLGALGIPIAGNLLEAGHDLLVHNRTPAKAEALIAQGAQWAASPADAAVPGGVVATLLWDDASVEEIVGSAGFLKRLGRGGVHVCMSTISPDCARRLTAAHAEHGSELVAAPVFGLPAAAAARALWMPVSGPAGAKARVRPLLEAMGAKGVFDFGTDPGAAPAVKLAGNFLIISAAESMAQALGMARLQGLDQAAVADMLTSTLLTAEVYRRTGTSIAAGQNRMRQTRIPDKDLGLFVDAAGTGPAGVQIAEAILRMRAS